QPVLHQEGAVEAQEQQPELDLADRLVELLPGHLGPPEVEAREHRKHHGAEHHVVEVRHHEVGVGDVEVDRRGGEQHARQTTEQEGREKTDAVETFLFGGLTGVLLASPPIDFHVTDSYFVVAHFHYVVFGTVVFAMFAGFYFWWPKMTGKKLNETIGKIQFWLLFLGFHGTFLVQHWLGAAGFPRRYADYLPDDGFTTLNQISSISSFVLAASTLFFFWNVYITAKKAPMVGVDDPWGHGCSLEWATSCPPPPHNFTALPRIRSERPAFDLNHPHATVPSATDPERQ